jgi:hypothetical protein
MKLPAMRMIYYQQAKSIFINNLKKYFLLLIVFLFTQQLFAQVPTITSFLPTTAGPGDTVIITGTNLTAVTEVSVGGPVNFQIVSSTEIYAFIAVAGGNDVTLSYGFNDTTDEPYSVSLPGFTWDGTPIIYSVVPLTAKQGDTVTFTGRHLVMDVFNDPPTITFGGVAAASVKASSSTLIRAVVGSGASGNISVTGCCGTTTYPGFVFEVVPVINSFSPASASTGTTITIKGKYFTGATAVSFGTVVAKSFTVVDDTVITAVVGNGATGNIVVKTNLGTATLSGFTFTSPCTVTTSLTDTAICASRLPYSWNGKIIQSQGTYIDTLINAGGCDSVAILNVVVISGGTLPIVTNASRCGAGPVTLGATPSGTNDILKWYSDTALTTQVTTGTSFTTPPLSSTTKYYVTESNVSGCTSVAIDAIATINRIPPAPIVSSVVYYQQNQTASALTATPNIGDTLVWYSTATGGIGNRVAPIPSTTTLDSTTYYVSQVGSCGESPRAATTVIIESSIPVQICPLIGTAIIVSNLTSATNNYQWQLNSGNGFNNITADSNYIGAVDDSMLQLNQIPSSWYGYQYRCVVNGASSNIYTLKFVDTWISTTDSTWGTAANWGCDRLPDSNTDVIINSGTVVLKSNATVRSLMVSPGASFTVAVGNKLTITH